MLALLRNLRDTLDRIGSEPLPVLDAPKPTWEVRDSEQSYARLNDPASQDSNCYGQKIDLLELVGDELPANESLYINGNPSVGNNPNRYKQHGFHFTADNCIGCHACEAACSEKNGNPAHISFRSVGYVEGGSYPDYQRMNISMACNHCDDPVCLKGCPTRAYTKHLEYGAVLQDPDTCFGCGYCTWVCPYNAPQLDPVEGQVSKCNMCVDRLEEGLKPACVSACLGNALDFGVVENTPENREQILTAIPGFPDPEITHPNIRFQQTKTMAHEVSRTDSAPIKYSQDDKGRFRSVVDEKLGKERHWNLNKLSSRENPLVLFTLASQASIGGFTLFLFSSWTPALQQLSNGLLSIPFLLSLLALQSLALLMSTVHLGKPLRFYRGFNNLKHSPLSREALGVAAFLSGLSLYTLLHVAQFWWQSGSAALAADVVGVFAVASGLTGLWYMTRIYRIKARPFWNHWQVTSSFFGNSLSLGATLFAVFSVAQVAIAGGDPSFSLRVAAGLVLFGILVESLGLFAHARYLNLESGEGAAAHYVQCTTFGKTYWLRNGLLIACTMLAGAVASMGASTPGILLSILLGVALLSSVLISRALFYVLVIPTTMPGAFFWKNKSFEQHARDTGLADMPQVVVGPLSH